MMTFNQKSSLLIFTLLALSISDVWAQGELDEPDDTEGSIRTGLNSNQLDKERRQLDISKKLPPPLDQKDLRVCWAFCISSIASALDNTLKEDGYFLTKDGKANFDRIYSPELAIQRYFSEGDCNRGARSREMLTTVLHDYGLVSYNRLPFTGQCKRPLASEIRSMAEANRKSNLMTEVLSNDDLTSVKIVLQQQQPLIMAIEIDKTFKQLKTDSSRADLTPVWKSFGTYADLHAMIVVGYDDTVGAFKVLNSWGSDWGHEGFAWITYELAKLKARYYCYPEFRKIPEDADASIADLKRETSVRGSTTSSDETKVTYASWMKEGYYREIGDLRIGVKVLNPRKGYAIINVSKDENELMSMYLDVGTSKSFSVDNVRYLLTFNNIGNPTINIFKKAMIFSVEYSN